MEKTGVSAAEQLCVLWCWPLGYPTPSGYPGKRLLMVESHSWPPILSWPCCVDFLSSISSWPSASSWSKEPSRCGELCHSSKVLLIAIALLILQAFVFEFALLIHCILLFFFQCLKPGNNKKEAKKLKRFRVLQKINR